MKTKLGGSGWGHLLKGMRLRALSQLKPGMLLLEHSEQHHARNVVEVTRIGNDVTDKIFYGRFVEPNDPGTLRAGANEDGFAVWDHNIADDDARFWIADPRRLRMLRYILVTSCEGGSNYWMQARKLKREDKRLPEDYDDLQGRGYLDYISMEVRSVEERAKNAAFDTGAWLPLDADVINLGIKRILDSRKPDAPKNQYGHEEWRQRTACGVRDDIYNGLAACDRSNGDGGDYDADGADCIVQAGLWGHIVYG